MPDRLQSYAEDGRVQRSASAVIDLLRSAEFAITRDGLLAGCGNAEVLAFYRGIHLVQTGYYLFASQQETGRFEDINPNRAKPPRALTDLTLRKPLLAIWTPDRLQGLLALSASASQWPAERRSDIRVFLTKLREFRPYFNQLRLAKGELENYKRHREESGAIPYWRYYLPAWGGLASMKEQLKPILPGKKLVDFDAELRDLLNRVKKRGDPALSGCYEAGQGFEMKYTIDNKRVVSEKLFLPIYYMLRFWERREAEGTSDLADTLIAASIRKLTP